MAVRKSISPRLETLVATLSRRRCCLCVFLDDRDEVRKGQVAHLNRDRSDNRFENLVWLCLDHHDDYDSRTSQSKGLSEDELRFWRDRLVQKYDGPQATWTAGANSTGMTRAKQVRRTSDAKHQPQARPWRFPLWQEPDQLELFAYTAGNRADGVCLIERIDLPDGRTVIACLQAAGNPGISITNCVEDIAAQVCARFDIPPAKLVWLEHYPHIKPAEWDLVEFEGRPPQSAFHGPRWIEMDAEKWRALGLRPRARLQPNGLGIQSKLTKLFANAR